MRSAKSCFAGRRLSEGYAALFFLLMAGCGMNNRVLNSMTISPASADAQNFTNGQVQFTATGSFSQPPSPAAVTPDTWSSSNVQIATIDQNGMAQCVQGTTGMVTIVASVSFATRLAGPAGTAILRVVSAKATLNCP